jgi:hypothetical protein
VLPLQIEIVYNNGGYIATAQEEAYYNVFSDDEPADTLQTFQKPPGTELPQHHYWAVTQ